MRRIAYTLGILLCAVSIATTAATIGTPIRAAAEGNREHPPLLAATGVGAPAGQSPLPVTIAIDRLDPGRPVPARFLGLSFEAAALGQLAQYA